MDTINKGGTGESLSDKGKRDTKDLEVELRLRRELSDASATIDALFAEIDTLRMENRFLIRENTFLLRTSNIGLGERYGYRNAPYPHRPVEVPIVEEDGEPTQAPAYL